MSQFRTYEHNGGHRVQFCWDGHSLNRVLVLKGWFKSVRDYQPGKLLGL